MTDQKAPTRRQLEAMFMIYMGRSPFQRDDNHFGRKYASNAGGAVGRMIQAVGDAGWLEVSERGYVRHRLTVAGLHALNTGRYDLPDFSARVAEQEERERAAREAQKAKDAEARAEIERRRLARQTARPSLFREIMQSYQINVDGLTDDQCRDIWVAIVDKEMEL